jgi:hypothetical protein
MQSRIFSPSTLIRLCNLSFSSCHRALIENGLEHLNFANEGLHSGTLLADAYPSELFATVK